MFIFNSSFIIRQILLSCFIQIVDTMRLLMLQMTILFFFLFFRNNFTFRFFLQLLTLLLLVIKDTNTLTFCMPMVNLMHNFRIALQLIHHNLLYPQSATFPNFLHRLRKWYFEPKISCIKEAILYQFIDCLVTSQYLYFCFIYDLFLGLEFLLHLG